MADEADLKRPSIPTWQVKLPAEEPREEAASSPDSPEQAGGEIPTQDRSVLLEQAKMFLGEASVRDAPRPNKVLFLEKKGLHGDEIQKLLDTSSPQPPSSQRQDSGMETIHDSSATSSVASTTATSATSPLPSTSTNTTPASQPTRVPPIITYPEFLLRPTKPPPLITLQRLTWALYSLAGVSALTYSASKHLVQPMLESLTSARHQLADTTLHNLEKLNEKLQGTVSHIPASSNSLPLKQRERDRHRRNDSESDADSIDSDPTELFHRDIATQTSPQPTLSPSPNHSLSSSSLNSSTPLLPPSQDTLSTQSSRLSTLTSLLTSLLPSSSPSSSDPTLLTTLTDTQSYLTQLQYIQNSVNVNYNLNYNNFNNYNNQPDQARSQLRANDHEDEAMRFRQEIRAIKGALLSIRTFPAAAAVVGAGAPT